MILREAEMTPAVFDWLKRQGLTPYTEVVPPQWIRGIDVVGWDGGKRIVAIEMKLSMTKALIWQGSLCQSITSEVYCAVRSLPRVTGIEKCRKWGIGIIRVLEDFAMVVLEPGENRVRSIIEERHDGIIKRLRKMDPGGIGGLPSLKGVGHARDVRKRVIDHLVEYPNSTWEEMHDILDNHYSSWKSMRGAQKMLEETLDKSETDGVSLFTKRVDSKK